MSLDAAITLAVILAVLAVLVADRVSPAFAVLGGTVALLVSGVIDADDAFAGFSNSAPLTVAALYVVAAATARTRVIESLAARFTTGVANGAGGGERRSLARIVVPTAASSAFLNNTPIVAMAIPPVVAWARRTGRSPSRYLMPISFAAVVGGTVTLIGTSTNLVVSGLLEDAGLEPMGLFEIGKVGLPFAVLSVIVMILITPRLLPERRAPSEDADADAREFTLEMIVEDRSPIVGRSVAEAGLRNLQGVYLVEVERDGNRISSVRPDEILAAGDRLTFAGNVERVIDLQGIRGLVSAEERHFGRVGPALERRLYEAVIAPGSSLLGRTLKETGFRGRYGGAVIAIHRADERVQGKLGDVRLRTGDVLVVLAGPAFRPRALDRRDFLVVSALDGDPPPRAGKAPLVGLVLVGMIASVATGLIDILPAALLAAFAVVALGVLTATEARDSVDLDVIVLIAASFGLGRAIEQSGLAGDIVDALIEPLGRFGDLGLLFGVLLATIIVTEMISNNAAAVLLFPIAVATAAQAGLDPRPFAIAVALGASSSFLTPIGYQTNTMVYGVGGYRFGDFARLGFPLAILMVVVALVMIPIAWPLR
ncbi:SLC13 family permease [Miltoncostaea marina]|uniref:SLC13 family permease n=1 Tax=Miltoncostaea marina TaxID=2843215 RepID=UPI001C3E7644|nr:SLC13 family permease [Miltoncostaea marina]